MDLLGMVRALASHCAPVVVHRRLTRILILVEPILFYPAHQSVTPYGEQQMKTNNLGPTRLPVRSDCPPRVWKPFWRT